MQIPLVVCVFWVVRVTTIRESRTPSLLILQFVGWSWSERVCLIVCVWCGLLLSRCHWDTRRHILGNGDLSFSKRISTRNRSSSASLSLLLFLQCSRARNCLEGQGPTTSSNKFLASVLIAPSFCSVFVYECVSYGDERGQCPVLEGYHSSVSSPFNWITSLTIVRRKGLSVNGCAKWDYVLMWFLRDNIQLCFLQRQSVELFFSTKCEPRFCEYQYSQMDR